MGAKFTNDHSTGCAATMETKHKYRKKAWKVTICLLTQNEGERAREREREKARVGERETHTHTHSHTHLILACGVWLPWLLHSQWGDHW